MKLAAALLLLCACHVYDDQCVTPRDNPGGGVTVRLSDIQGVNGFQLIDSDGGDDGRHR